ncbi:plasminogen activator, urokinase a [Chanos chanos]|uniref:trypsin n=1 Tax=Chanos chanos TaxID=29144 RepID=A0A6J2V983_CHACN|nr:urokinase-type plasminogen activator-like [Chanos chanos]
MFLENHQIRKRMRLKWLPLLTLTTCLFPIITMASASRWSTRRSHRPAPAGECLRGNGRDYRGTVSETERGHTCVQWSWVDRPGSYRYGKHNYCRNPDDRSRPWCWVVNGNELKREFCNIPQCNPEPVPKKTAMDDGLPIFPPAETTCGERRLPTRRKIVGGSVSSVETQPWIASVFHRRSFLCGGSLIAPCWVLSAAHCFSEGRTMKKTRHLSVSLGKDYINQTEHSKEQHFKVEQLIIHEDYNSEKDFNNDMALLKIIGEDGQCAVKTRSVRTVCLPPENQMLPPGLYCDVAGYGKERWGGGYSKVLKKTQVKLISQPVCERNDYYGDKITENMFCAGSPDWTTDSCEGDSGGPLVCEVGNRMFLFGIVSWGEGCSKKFRPGVYTRVTNYNRWIALHTGLPSFTAGSMYPEK